MVLTDKQKQLVEENMGLVGKVLKDKLRQGSALGYWEREDLYQIGCVGLCKAAATDDGSCRFSTYAYRLVWNEICDALICGNRVAGKEFPYDPEAFEDSCYDSTAASTTRIDLNQSLLDISDKASHSLRAGIVVLRMMAEGYSSADIGRMMNLRPNAVRTLASRARKLLKGTPELISLWNGGAE